LFFYLLSIQSQSQTYVKLTPNHFVDHSNVGIETSIGKKSTFQLDILGSPWKSINGKPQQFYVVIPEYRYHFNGFYAGVHIGGTVFNFKNGTI
jgi:hypothetical protein